MRIDVSKQAGSDWNADYSGHQDGPDVAEIDVLPYCGNGLALRDHGTDDDEGGSYGRRYGVKLYAQGNQPRPKTGEPVDKAAEERASHNDDGRNCGHGIHAPALGG